MTEKTPQLPQVVESCHQMIQWLIPQIDRFPRNRRFTLGEGRVVS